MSTGRVAFTFLRLLQRRWPAGRPAESRGAPTQALKSWVQCRRCSQQARGTGTRRSGRQRELRRQRTEVLRQNRRNPDMERAARLGQLVVPLSEVHREWQRLEGWRLLQTAGLHFNVFADVFGSVFLPQGFMRIVYQEKCPVHRGNIISAADATQPPKVSLPPSLPPQSLSTLILTSPDSHLTSHTHEVVHWMLADIRGGDVATGQSVFSYLPPVPPRGTGLHRLVFALYTHSSPLELPQAHTTGEWLEQHSFSSQAFIANHDLRPFTFSFYQTQWDHTVHDTYMHTLASPEPVYDLEKEPSRHKRSQLEFKQRRANRYRNM